MNPFLFKGVMIGTSSNFGAADAKGEASGVDDVDTPAGLTFSACPNIEKG
jgi:hypothetical protein